MNILKRVCLIIIVISTSIVLIELGLKGFDGRNTTSLTDISLQCMHISLFIGGILTIIRCYKAKDWLYFITFIIPEILLILSIVLVFWNIRFPSITFLIFDLYLIIISVSYLSLDLKKTEKSN